MVAIFVILTIIFFLGLDMLVRHRSEKKVVPEVLPLAHLSRLLPRGVFVQPNFTWSRILDDGNIALGIHPLLLGLTGKPDEITTLSTGEEALKGKSLLSIRKGERHLHLNAPTDGIIRRVNPDMKSIEQETDFENNWLFVIEPAHLSEELPGWMIAEKAEAWLGRKYQQIRDFLVGSGLNPEAGATLADGGDIPVGVLSELDEGIWHRFEVDFCNSDSEISN